MLLGPATARLGEKEKEKGVVVGAALILLTPLQRPRPPVCLVSFHRVKKNLLPWPRQSRQLILQLEILALTTF